MPKKPLILITNDDGITAPGIRTLIEVMKELGDIVVIAPDSPQRWRWSHHRAGWCTRLGSPGLE